MLVPFLQLINSDYSERSKSNAIQERPIYPTRGLIYDRNNNLLVANKPVYDLMVVPENINAFDTLALISILKISKKDLQKKIESAENFSKKLPSVLVLISLRFVSLVYPRTFEAIGIM